jgi:hypothetical protein
MDIDKSLYMKEFLEIRETLGSVFNKPGENVLFTNLYNAFLPRTIQTKVKDIVEEIEEKTILIKDNKQVKNDMTLFDDAPIQEDVGKLQINETVLMDTSEENIEDKEPNIEDKEPNIVADEEPSIVADEGVDEEVDKDEQVDKDEEVDIDLIGGGRQLKKIVINPNYVASDK